MALPGDLTGPIELALARSATQLPGRAAGPGSCWRYELKWDGYRAVIIREGRRTRIWSRQGKNLSDRFPDILTTIAAQVSRDCVIDGELVVWDKDRLSFGALQQRLVNPAGKAASLAAARPASFVAFDLLAVGHRDLRRHTWTARRAALEHLSTGWAPPLQLSPVTADVTEAQGWMSLYYRAGIEGIVAKDAESTYRQGQRVWSKIKHRETLEVIVGAVIGATHSPTAVVGARYDGRDLIMIGRTGDLTPIQAREVSALVQPSEDHPWPPTTASGRWESTGGSAPWTRVAPRVVVEVAADAARQGLQCRHPLRYVRHRADLSPADVAPAGADT